MKNKSLLIAFVLLFWAVPSEAQRFEWVRGYAPGENVNIVGSVVDSVGNLYILGSINFNTCWENGSRLLPIVPHGHRQDNGDVLIAKVSPEGNLVWHKVIHGSFTGSDAHDIKKLGDTAFACLVTMPLATDYYYLYYLDTMIQASGSRTDWPDYPMNAKYVNHKCLALITFDFEGNVLEQHFLQMSFLDYNGEDITSPPNTRYGPNRWLNIKDVMFPSFAIDNEGNIYLSRYTYDMTSTGPDQLYSVEDGTISAVKFWCDRREVGIAPVYSNLPTSPQILKFSPHFDTLLNARYILQNEGSSYFSSHHLWCDKSNMIYYLYSIDNRLRNTTYMIDSTKNMAVSFSDAVSRSGFIIIYDNTLVPDYVLFMEDSVIQPDIHYSDVEFQDLAFDFDSNLVFISASTGRSAMNDTVSFYSILTFMGHPLLGLKNNSFFVSFKVTDDSVSYHSYGVNPSIGYSDCLHDLHVYGNLACDNNRIFMQSESFGGLRLPNRVLEWNFFQGSPGLIYYDYQGNVIEGSSYNAFGGSNRVGPISIKDSMLYLTNKLTSGATLGDIQVPSRGDYFACIAKYVDASFMTPYVSPAVRIRQADSTTVTLFPNPATDRVHVAVTSGEPVTEACVVTLNGIRRRVHVADGTVDLTGVPSGILFLQLVTPTQIYTHKIIKL